MIDLAIIGAGPAGMAAALFAAQSGLSVAVFDEQARVGGQIFRQPPEGASDGPAYRLYPFGRGLVAAAEAETRIDWRFRRTVWGLFPTEGGIRVCATGGDVIARKVLVATGAYEMPVAFPGWTLPGVMGVGAIQTLIKAQNVVPGRRFVLAGSHPLLILVADLLVQAGAEVPMVAFARPIPRLAEMVDGLAALPGNGAIMAEAGRSVLRLARAGVPIRFGRIVTGADGSDRVDAVTLARCDADWCVQGPGERIAADVLGVGFGLLPSTELCRQAGCATVWNPQFGGWIVAHDGAQRTNIANLYVAGEPAGIRGAESAWIEGQIAARSICADLGLTTAGDGLARQRRRNRRFSDRVARFFAPNADALAALVTPDTLICRCEEVTRAEIDRLLTRNAHLSDVDSVKLACRAGMGPCQGRYCQHNVARIVSQRRGIAVEACGAFRAQAPVKPIPLGDLAGQDQTKL